MTIQEQADAILAQHDICDLTVRLAMDRDALLVACKALLHDECPCVPCQMARKAIAQAERPR